MTASSIPAPAPAKGGRDRLRRPKAAQRTCGACAWWKPMCVGRPVGDCKAPLPQWIQSDPRVQKAAAPADDCACYRSRRDEDPCGVMPCGHQLACALTDTTGALYCTGCRRDADEPTVIDGATDIHASTETDTDVGTDPQGDLQ